MPTIGLDLETVVPAAPAKPLFTVDGIVKHVCTAALVILLLPAMLVVGAVALLVPCLLRVPVCGPSPPSIRMSRRP